MLRKTYGLTVEQYMAMAEAQGHVCKICGKPETDKYGALHVDHDHQTSTVRGLLCGQCNTALGKFRDDPALLRAAIAYLDAAFDRAEGETFPDRPEVHTRACAPSEGFV